MDSLVKLFVLPTGNTLPTTGTNADLTGQGTTPNQFGIFLPSLAPATVGSAGSAKYLTMSQTRNIATLKEGTMDSDKVYPGRVYQWYKVPGNLTASTQITEISSWTMGCQEDISVTLRLFSYYINASYYNGLTRSVMVTTPCCGCGSNPCEELSSGDVTTVLQELANAINDDEILSLFVVAGVNVAGTALVIEGLPLAADGSTCDLTNNPYQLDRMYFYTFVRSGPELTTDYEVDDICNLIATPSILQRASYPQNTPAEIQQMEKNYFYGDTELNQIFSNPNYNGEFQSYVDSALAYNLYYLHFYEPIIGGTQVGVEAEEEIVILAIPAGDTNEAATIAILSAAYGTPQNEVATPSTTTTITTTSTSTSSTTMSPQP